MGAEADAGPVGGLHGVDGALAALDERGEELVGEVRMGAAVAGALGEAEVRFLAEIVDALRREWADAGGQALGVVGHRDFFRNLVLGELRGVEDVRFAFDERPFEGFFGAVDVDAFAVLTRGVEEGADDAGGEIGVLELDVGGLDGEGGVVFRDEFGADRAGAETGDVFGGGIGEREHGADAVRGIPHGREARPVVRPAVHVLLVARLEKLDFAEVAAVVEFFDVEVFAGVNDRLHHHVVEASFFGEIDDAFAIGDGGRHRDGAGDVFAGFERFDGLLGVVGDRRVDVNGVDVGILEELVVIGVAARNAEGVLNGFKFLRVALADGEQVGVGVRLVNRNKLGAETKADDGDVEFFAHGKRRKAADYFRVWMKASMSESSCGLKMSPIGGMGEMV